MKKRKKRRPKLQSLSDTQFRKTAHVYVRRVALFRREFHLASGLSLYYILLVESSFLPGNIFLRFFIEMHSNFMHLIESKAKLDYK